MHSTWADQAWAVFRKDLLLEARTRANVNAMVFFAAIVLLVFSFALGPDTGRLQAAAGGLLWLAFIFAGILAFGRSYQLEAENNAFEAFILPMMAVLYNLDLWGAVPLLTVIGILGTLGFASVGALYGALTMSLRAREVLLPLLLLPVSVPVVVAAVKATSYVLTGQEADLGIWLELLVAFDVVFITAGLLTFEYAVGD